jgi:predicted nucleic acid-binding protein
MSHPIFLDASFWINCRDEREPFHSLARQVVADLFKKKAHFVTTLPVVCEIHSYFARNSWIRETVLKELCENPIVTLEEISHQDQKEALKILRNHRDKDYSLCDAISFVVMRRLRLTRALAFDDHFRQFGEFEIIPDKFP